ncbi:hypothetical protein [Blastopirellula marina]|uniref:Carboxypeptidase regulatory-like domain-containing protein n=1 Tax=Blastopirellula marina DSM 3645 TaxID=314230 RepID=A3ZP03_9BACT|nr:hypothetical protein [Blastopirellula marina]EAQ81550.1 hypothetical protein DSM3645_28252 [Blastopirellula marina DSM 3645]
MTAIRSYNELQISRLVDLMIPSRLILVFVIAFALNGIGCGSATPINGQVISGTVTVNGKPLARGLIIFQPMQGTAGPTATAEIRDGQFVTKKNIGPWPGKFLVKIESTPPDVIAMIEGASPEEMHRRAREPHKMIAPKFNRDSQITVEVLNGDNPPFNFDTKWD